MKQRNLVLITVLSLLSVNEALRVLVLFPIVSKSHSILGHGVANRLLEAGHEVVLITAFPSEKSVPNLKEIELVVAKEKYHEIMEKFKEDMKLKNFVGKQNFGDSIFFLYMVNDIHKTVLSDPTLIELLSDPNEKFDAVIINWFFSEVFSGIPPLFGCPLIWVGSMEAHWQVLRLMGEVPGPSYSVDIFSTSSTPLSFYERAVSLWRVLYRYALITIFQLPFERSLYNDVFSKIAEKKGIELPSFDEAAHNASLVFLNAHPSLGKSLSLPQNVKNVAGYHIDEKLKPLPNDLQKLMDEAKHGVIYFSMGSNVKSMDMSDEMKSSLLAMFGKLKQTVIWKFEGDLDNVPANVHLVKWAPQPSILAHKNLKIFVTHGGQLSTTEAVYYGVPLIGVPVTADQQVNLNSVAQKGFGIKLQFTENLANDLVVAIREMLSNPKYVNKAKELHYIYHNKPLSAGKELVYWVDHVVHTHGAKYLRSPASFVPWYQKAYLDLLAVVLIILSLIIVVLKRVMPRRIVKQKTS